MSMVNRAAGRSSNKNVRIETTSITKQAIKKETISFVEKEKKQVKLITACIFENYCFQN